MSPEERWARIQALCEEMEPLADSEQPAHLERAESDPAIREEVRQMLSALRNEAKVRAEYLPPVESTPTERKTIGPYTILDYLGRGGTGTVYAAEIDRAGVKQQVAVKVLHAHLNDGETESRFRREQQMLAQLDHPGITRVLDAGVTEEQQPYLVMDRVDGEPIDAYCDLHQLTVEARLRLMMEVCDAVQAAHRSLIVHLDLKPSNLLVTKDGRAKLLDFGTAKLVRPGDLTMTRQMTPLYASPEQLRGESVTTACDVYSLGVVLFELLTGEWPFGSRDSMVAVWERAAGYSESRKLTELLSPEAAARRGTDIGTLRKALSGDLQVILGRALALEPDRRYQSAAALGEDLDRYLQNRPVLAQRQTRAYRLRKYVQRNRGVLSLTTLMLIGLGAALGYGWWQQQERLRAARVAQETSEFLNWMIQSSRPMYGGRQDMPVRELVQKAGAEVGRRRDLSDPAATTLLLSLGAYLAEAGDADGSLRMMQEAERRAATPEERLGARTNLAGLTMGLGRCEEALAIARKADEDAREQSLAPPAKVSYLSTRSELMAACEGKGGEVLAFLQPLPELVRQIPDDARDVAMRAGLFKALALNSYAMALYKARRYDEALAMIDEGLRYAGKGPDSPGVRIALLRSISFIEGGKGRARESAAALGEAVALSEGFTSPFEFLRLKVMWATKLGLAGEKERPAEIARATITETHRRANEIGPQRWMILSDAGLALLRSGNCEGVPELMQEVDSIAGPSLPAQWRGNRLYTEGLCLVRTGRTEPGKQRVREALTVLGPLFTPGSQLKKELEAALR